jgi:regulator of protease activity HflC (stomatin/prohibitin superfamily)
MFWKRIIVGDQERILISKNGRFSTILTPGEYRLFVSPTVRLEVETHYTNSLVFQSTWADYLVKERPQLVAEFFTVVETTDTQVAMVYVDGKLFKVLAPAKRALFWRGLSGVSAEVVDVIDEQSVPPAKLPALERLGRESLATFSIVEEARIGLFYLDNRLIRTLTPGKYGFWAVAGNPRVDVVDLRRQILEVPGQEILSKDKVSLRVNILAEFQVIDAIKAKQMVKDFTEYLYRLLQRAVRQTLGRKTLEEILADKTDVEEPVAEAVRTEMSAMGVEVGSISLKDIILPGDVRAIMNQVVSAEKQAQANLIRRREETAATRSLLNTAKLLEDNPILVRLKELETLEKLVEKVDRVSVSGGFQGLLDNLMELQTVGSKSGAK